MKKKSHLNPTNYSSMSFLEKKKGCWASVLLANSNHNSVQTRPNVCFQIWVTLTMKWHSRRSKTDPSSASNVCYCFTLQWRSGGCIISLSTRLWGWRHSLHVSQKTSPSNRDYTIRQLCIPRNQHQSVICGNNVYSSNNNQGLWIFRMCCSHSHSEDICSSSNSSVYTWVPVRL